MATPVDGEIEQQGGLELTSPAFAAGERLPDRFGFANENASPPLAISGIPEGTESLVLIMDDPEAKPVAGHVWDHWLVFDIDPDTTEIPENWDPEADGATEGYNDYVQQGWGGPSPPGRSEQAPSTQRTAVRAARSPAWEAVAPGRRARASSRPRADGEVAMARSETGRTGRIACATSARRLHTPAAHVTYWARLKSSMRHGYRRRASREKLRPSRCRSVETTSQKPGDQKGISENGTPPAQSPFIAPSSSSSTTCV
jgi:hypothetical protein